jgi:hypothetical protein
MLIVLQQASSQGDQWVLHSEPQGGTHNLDNARSSLASRLMP